jgi:hypothetical protein
MLEFASEAQKAGRSQTSRLWVVDVGRDALQLRSKYPDTVHHLIGRGVVQPFLKERSRREKRPLPQPRLSARIDPERFAAVDLRAVATQQGVAGLESPP